MESALNGAVSASHQQQGQHHVTTLKAGIDLKEGTVAADRIHLQRGAIIDVGKLVRQDGQDGLPEVTGTQALDTERMFNLRMSTCGSSDVSQHDRLIVAEGKKR